MGEEDEVHFVARAYIRKLNSNTYEISFLLSSTNTTIVKNLALCPFLYILI